MQLVVGLSGTTPLVCHNVRLADPADKATRQIKQLTSKRTRTEDDHAEIERWEFLGGLYLEPVDDFVNGIPVMPTWNIKRCFEEAAKVTRQGKNLSRALVPLELNTPLHYDGPETAEALWKDDRFQWRTMVGVQRAKTSRLRPRFDTWAVETAFELLTDLLDKDEFARIADYAGRIEGLGDARKLGFGRFEAQVS